MKKEPVIVELDSLVDESIDVATFNADPFAVEDEYQLMDVLDECGYWVEKYTKGTDGFEELAEKLDGDEDTFKAIYVSEGVIFGTLK